MAQSPITKAEFRALVWRYYKTHGRHDLPWRQTKNLYRILVSEVMLQQTQVDRVIDYYQRFIKKYPTVQRLAAAPLSEVIKLWQGLGYNRRAKMLREAARMLASTSSFRTRFNLVEELEKLPGVGPYTARAVAAFAWNHDGVVIETNIRTAIIHHFFNAHDATMSRVSDREIEEVLVRLLPRGRAREWYSALMDYGAYLKRSGISHNAKSSGYVKQTPLKGSLREVRGAVLKTLSHGPASRTTLQTLFDSTRRGQVRTALTALENEGFITKNRTYYALA